MHDGLKLVSLAALLAILVLLFIGWGLDQWQPFIVELRFRKLASLLLVGGSIGIATVIFQTLVANRILTPGMMGFDALFLFMQTGLILLIGSVNYFTLPVTAKFVIEVSIMVGIAVLFFSILLRRIGGDISKLLLIGIVIGILLRSLNSFMHRLLDPSAFVVLQGVMFASFGAVDEINLLLSTIVIAACIVAAMFMAPRLDVVALGRKKSMSLGINYNTMMLFGLAVVSVLIAVATSLVGPITFLGLLVASLARMSITSFRHVLLLPVAGMIGALILVAGQFVFERIFQMQSALAIIIEFVGGLLFMLLLLRKGNN